MKPTALIDGDIIAYRVAAACQTTEGWKPDPAFVPTFAEDDVKRGVARTVADWTFRSGCDGHVVLLTGSLNFRKLVDPTYKMNRADNVKPVALRFAREYLLNEYRARMVDGLEADDLIGLMLTGSMTDGRGVSVSIDKDLRTVPGLHFNPTKDNQVVSVTPTEADHLWMLQTLTGDPVDGYKGAVGVGPAKAAKLLPKALSVTALWPTVVGGFIKVGMTREDALTTARLARILRTGDYDKDAKEVQLWHPNGDVERLALPVYPQKDVTP